ncbi:MAG: hypothetical protein A2Z25_20340 [Planctomycetes bacterium RBG_16_55_9]|nr:MAG: hypothetical protein A2Z25_20340 [Planctomycetes bacterium RBG_16_55_9]
MVSMDYQFIRHVIADWMPHPEATLLSDDGISRFNLSLLIETVLVTIAAIGAVKIFSASSVLGPDWQITPVILIVAALFPMWLNKRNFPPLGLNVRRLKDTSFLLGGTWVAVLPLMFCGLWLLRSFGFESFLPPALPIERGWIHWLLYQFICIALAEEVFFRGYLLGNIPKLAKPMIGKWPRRQRWVSIATSAGCFALAHVIIQGRIASALTFLPGLILGWLFIRTEALLAPILFHGSANVCYLLMTKVFAQTSGPSNDLRAVHSPIIDLVLLWQ